MAKVLPQIYYGLHMRPGVAEYADIATNNGAPYRVLIEENACKQMDPSFQGRPVYVDHVENVNLDDIDAADGYVVESFFNPVDGNHWAKFLVKTDRGHEAIRSGWVLSNAYHQKEMGGGGKWHGVEYLKEILRGEYDHLAIVQNPRYRESVILTPDEFKKYNLDKAAELQSLKNSADEKPKGWKLMFEIFKTHKEKLTNAADLADSSVILPKSGKAVEFKKLINDADEEAMNADKPVMANGEHRIKVGDEEMSINELCEKHAAMKNELDELKKKNSDAKPADEKKPENSGDEKKPENADPGGIAPAANQPNPNNVVPNSESEADKQARMNSFNSLKNAEQVATDSKLNNSTFDAPGDGVARGQSRYGSGK